MSDMGTCPLPELVAEFRKSAKKADEDNDLLRSMLFSVIGNRFQRCQDLLSLWLDEQTPELTSKDLISKTEKELGVE